MNDILHGSFETLLPNIPSESVDLVITSPPYDKIRTYDKFSIDLSLLGKELFRTVKNGGVCCLVINDQTKDFHKSLTSFRLVLNWCDNFGWKLFETVIYHKDGRPGAWWAKRFRVDHEYIFIFFKGNKPKSFDKSSLVIPAKHAGEMFHGTNRHTSGKLTKVKPLEQSQTKCRGTVWFYKTSNQEGIKKKLLHPATFPEKLAEDLILCFSKENDVILDPMCGSGTTLRQAKKHNRSYIGIDVSQQYCDLAKELI